MAVAASPVAVPVNFLNRDKTLDPVDPGQVKWKALTTGTFGGAELLLANPQAGRLKVQTPMVGFETEIVDIG